MHQNIKTGLALLMENIIWINRGRYNFAGPTKAKVLPCMADNNKEIGGSLGNADLLSAKMDYRFFSLF